MNTPRLQSRWLRLTFWTAATVLALTVWPLLAHRAYQQLDFPVPGSAAFFLGALALLSAAIAARLGAGVHRGGARWLKSREALGTYAVAAAFTLTLVVLFYSLELWRGKHAWTRAAARAEWHGESLDPRSAMPPPVPPDANFAAAPAFDRLWAADAALDDAPEREARSSRDPLTRLLELERRIRLQGDSLRIAPWMTQQVTDLERWWQTLRPEAAPAADHTNAPVLARLILQELEPTADLVEALRPYSTRPFCRLPSDVLAAHFSEFHAERVLLGLAHALRIRAAAGQALDQHEAAFADLQFCLRLGRHLSQTPLLFLQEQRAYAIADGLQPLWEGLRQQRWTAAQLGQLHALLSTWDPLAHYEAHVRSLAFANAGFVEAIIPTISPADSLTRFSPKGQAALRWVRWIYPTGWSLQDQAAIHQLRLDLLAAGPDEMPPAHREQAVARQLARRTSDPFFMVFLVPRLAMMNLELQRYLPFEQTLVHLARVAVALARCRLDQGQYPEALPALVPGYLDTLPADPMTGEPLVYQRTGPDTFVLYSAGANRADDGGQPSPRQHSGTGEPESTYALERGDWVWAQHE